MTRIMVIAGTDSSGGAGLTRDVTTATQLGCGVLPVVTAVTVQTDRALRQVHNIPADMISGQIAAALNATPPAAIKIGMLGDADAILAVAEALNTYPGPIVLDPVLTTTSGGLLTDQAALAPILRLATLVTPNLDEAAALTNRPFANTCADIDGQAQTLLRMGINAALIKGGHGKSAICTDYLFTPTGRHQFAAKRIGTNKRGTGCTLATAIACYLAANTPLHTACDLGIKHVRHWLSNRPDGPTNT